MDFSQAVIDEFISFYNYERINKDGFTPYEIRSKTIWLFFYKAFLFSSAKFGSVQWVGDFFICKDFLRD